MTRNADNRTTELLQVGDILLNEPANERIVVVDADAVSVWLRKVEKNDELLIYDGNVWAKLGIKHGNKNRCSQHYAQTVFEFDGHVQQAIAASLGNGTLTAEQVMKIAGKHQPDYCSDTHVCFDWQAIADELNAAAGQGTCIPHGEWERLSQTQEFRRMYCDCGYELGTDSRDSFPFARTAYAAMPRFCPECGARIVSKWKAVKR